MKKINSLMIAIMFETPINENTFSFFDLIVNVKQKFGKYLANVDPIQLAPNNQNINPEVIRYAFESNKIGFSFSPVRFEFNFIDKSLLNKECIDNELQNVLEVLEILSKSILPQFRVGVVTRGNIDMNEQSKNIMNKYLNIENLKNADEYNISFRETKNTDGLTLNTWTKYHQFKNSNLISYEFDINIGDFINHKILKDKVMTLLLDGVGDYLDRDSN